MNMALGYSVVMLLLLVVFALVIPTLVGVYVYRDASRRDMSAPLWTLIAVVTPGLVGLIIYLIVRSGHSGRRCPGCKAPVQQSFNLCPHCGMTLKERCSQCGLPLEPEWQLCPNCGTSLNRPALAEPEKKDRGIGWILGAVLFAPVCLLVLMLVLAFANLADADAGHSITWGRNESPIYFMGSKEIALWMQECDDLGEGAYALYTANEAAETRIKTRYLIYINDETLWDVECDLEEGGNFKDAEVQVQLKPLEEGEESTNLFYVATTYEKAAELVLRDANGQVVPVRPQWATTPDALMLINGANWKNRLAVQVAQNVPEAYGVQVRFYAGALLLGSDGAANDDGAPLCRAEDTYYFFAPTSTSGAELIFLDETGGEIFRQRLSLDDFKGWTIPLMLERDENGTLALSCAEE